MSQFAFHITFFFKLVIWKSNLLRLWILELKFFEFPHFTNTFSVICNPISNIPFMKIIKILTYKIPERNFFNTVLNLFAPFVLIPFALCINQFDTLRKMFEPESMQQKSSIRELFRKTYVAKYFFHFNIFQMERNNWLDYWSIIWVPRFVVSQRLFIFLCDDHLWSYFFLFGINLGKNYSFLDC